MNVFLSTLTTFSALILVIILFTSDYKRSDKTWKSFSAMVLFYFAYDILILLRSLSSNEMIRSFTSFTAVCCSVLALFEFHYYLICFFRDKKMVEIPDTTKYVGGAGIVFLLGWTLYNVFFGSVDELIRLYFQNILGYLRLMMVVPDFFFVWRRSDLVGRRAGTIWCSHLLLPTLFSYIDNKTGSNYTFFITTMFVLLIYITINQETELSIIKQKIDLEKKERELQDVKRHVMISQIQPHFIYNVLNIICILCRRNPKEAARTTRLFAKYLKTPFYL